MFADKEMVINSLEMVSVNIMNAIGNGDKEAVVEAFKVLEEVSAHVDESVSGYVMELLEMYKNLDEAYDGFLYTVLHVVHFCLLYLRMHG